LIDQWCVGVLLDLLRARLVDGVITRLPVSLVALSWRFACVIVVGKLLLRVQKQFFDVVWVLAGVLLFAVVVFLGHQIGILFLVMSSHRPVQWLALVISAVAIAKGGLIAPYHVHVELVLGRHGRSVVLRLLDAIVRIVYCRAGDSVRCSNAVLQVYYGRPWLDVVVAAASAE